MNVRAAWKPAHRVTLQLLRHRNVAGNLRRADDYAVRGLQVPMELRLELGTLVGLHDVNAKGQALPHPVNEPHCHALVADCGALRLTLTATFLRQVLGQERLT